MRNRKLPQEIFELASEHRPSAAPRQEGGGPHQVLSNDEVDRLLNEVSDTPDTLPHIDPNQAKSLLRRTLARLWIMTDRASSEYEIIGEDIIFGRLEDFSTLIDALDTVSYEIYKHVVQKPN